MICLKNSSTNKTTKKKAGKKSIKPHLLSKKSNFPPLEKTLHAPTVGIPLKKTPSKPKFLNLQNNMNHYETEILSPSLTIEEVKIIKVIKVVSQGKGV